MVVHTLSISSFFPRIPRGRHQPFRPILAILPRLLLLQHAEGLAGEAGAIEALFVAQSDRNPAQHSDPESLEARRFYLRGRDDLKAKVPAFIDYDNRTMTKSCKWTYQGKVLTA